MMSNKDEQLELAKLAEQTERYADMVTAMKKVVESNSELTIEERSLLSIAYKNWIGTHRVPLRVLSTIEQKGKGTEHQQQMVKDYRKQIESELESTCHEVLTLLDKYLIPKATTAESKIFFLKMKGDYYRYLAENATSVERQKWAEESQRAYKDGSDIAKEQMRASNPIRLGLALNFSVFHYEILNEPNAACRLAKQAFDDALPDLECIDERNYHDSTLIMQLLRDNLTLWTADDLESDDTNQLDEQQ